MARAVAKGAKHQSRHVSNTSLFCCSTLQSQRLTKVYSTSTLGSCDVSPGCLRCSEALEAVATLLQLRPPYSIVLDSVSSKTVSCSPVRLSVNRHR